MMNKSISKLSESELSKVTGGGKLGNFLIGNMGGFLSGPTGMMAGGAGYFTDVANKLDENNSVSDKEALCLGFMVGGAESTALMLAGGYYLVKKLRGKSNGKKNK